MRVLIAGDGGSVLAVAAELEASALGIEGLAEPASTPSGIPVYPLERLPERFDVSLWAGGETTSRTLAAAGAVALEEVTPGMLECSRPVVAVSAVTTGSGKTALTRRVARALRRMGRGVAVARHPIASLLHWDRFAPILVVGPPQLGPGRPIDEREELAPLVGAGIPVATGLDPGGVLRLAETAAGPGGVVVWDGGGAAAPWVRPDLQIVAVDLLRPPPHEARERIASADLVVLTKADSAPEEQTRAVERTIRSWNAEVPIVLADLPVVASDGPTLRNSRVVVVEDAPSLLLGGLRAGAGAVAARRFRCGVVDPRPFAVGAIDRALAEHAHIGAVIPALGRTEDELADLAASVRATPGDVVLWASNADPAGVIPDEPRPIVRAFGELTEVAGDRWQELLETRL